MSYVHVAGALSSTGFTGSIGVDARAQAIAVHAPYVRGTNTIGAVASPSAVAGDKVDVRAGADVVAPVDLAAFGWAVEIFVDEAVAVVGIRLAVAFHRTLALAKFAAKAAGAGADARHPIALTVARARVAGSARALPNARRHNGGERRGPRLSQNSSQATHLLAAIEAKVAWFAGAGVALAKIGFAVA